MWHFRSVSQILKWGGCAEHLAVECIHCTSSSVMHNYQSEYGTSIQQRLCIKIVRKCNTLCYVNHQHAKLAYWQSRFGWHLSLEGCLTFQPTLYCVCSNCACANRLRRLTVGKPQSAGKQRIWWAGCCWLTISFTGPVLLFHSEPLKEDYIFCFSKL
jgi:hypothetical protein